MNTSFQTKSPYVTIKIKNNTWKTKAPNVTLKNLFKTVAYGSMIRYDVKENYFTVTVSVQITPATRIGNFEITYGWNKKKSKYTPEEINYNFYEIDINE